MKQIDQEKIKDIIIDYIYDFLYQDKVKIIKSDSVNITVDPNYDIKKDELLSSLLKSAVNSGKFKMYYGEREVSYCELVTSEGVHHEFLNRVERLGFERNKVNLELIISLIQELCDRGFVVRNQPKTDELKLSEKGLNHYKSGNSFEQKFIEYQEVRRANRISKIAIWVAGITALITLFTTLG